jgi:hypothetical protein
MAIPRRSNAGYDPVLGRWGAPDPLEQFHSPYLANFNNPANFVDPDGRMSNFAPAISAIESLVVALISKVSLETMTSAIKGGGGIDGGVFLSGACR